tara:strand:- start:183 stop:383 length:201 start_codon:yes stop_codon:yes gene_type:complete
MKRKAMTVRTTTLKIKLFLVSLSVMGISSSLNAVFASDPSFEVLLGERQLFLVACRFAWRQLGGDR